jgi:hypothetical protein
LQLVIAAAASLEGAEEPAVGLAYPLRSRSGRVARSRLRFVDYPNPLHKLCKTLVSPVPRPPGEFGSYRILGHYALKPRRGQLVFGMHGRRKGERCL